MRTQTINIETNNFNKFNQLLIRLKILKILQHDFGKV